ncbi:MULTISPECIES: glycosyltransferase family 2 protein [Phyllobacteriaceae]|jgi:succinoglycan biosynthesis protein ExoW|uniref:Succinoglycan biosynthesis protein exow n=1 Tax=Mesorhizobium hungaricum TaxID=1566387 RepID=A0A1C2DCY8_9HYPH|nr:MULTISPECIES: glycosyltransferase family 2 protein [Mesorhizobium]MBN9237710.1 glycosyltransferase family 2 protein [Mesorhizobium sp.]MDQ0330942.1 succinoglycan biosynthesis protein ExoW [Mesorhizobium sp. YL-MeA3-2017]OCX12525.1 succinoglycan biosynthesis protein exow [Mesorhizobium hungaricum]
MTKCTVIIPYYQREPGILARALTSVFAQTHSDFDVIVVDDASPSPAEDDLQMFSLAERARIAVIKQPNAGPGGARNMGLDHIGADSAYAAFLDSDDEWAPNHLKNAVGALSLFDADCYWASIKGGAEFYYHFGVADLADVTEVVRLGDNPPIVEIPELAATMLKNWSFLHLSCMVIGPALFRQMRFDASLRLAAEDVLFFYDCVRNARRVVLSEGIGAVRGEGINIFHGMGSDSPLFLKQQFNTWVALDRLQSRFPHRPDEKASIEAYKQTARNQALWGQARLVRARKAPQLRQLAQWAWRDPKLLRSAVGLAVSKMSK